MESSNEIIRQIIIEVVNENFDPEEGHYLLEKLSREEWEQLDTQISTYVAESLWRILPSGVLGGLTNVLCLLPNNLEIVARSAAVQCKNCSEYFCRKHKLKKCPLCDGSFNE